MELTIIVIEAGFVYVGYPEKFEHEILGPVCLLRQAKNIRVWGTTDGLGQLAQTGITENTKLDFVGTIDVPISKILHFVRVEPDIADTFF